MSAATGRLTISERDTPVIGELRWIVFSGPTPTVPTDRMRSIGSDGLTSQGLCSSWIQALMMATARHRISSQDRTFADTPVAPLTAAISSIRFKRQDR